jgi:hypothetical protein
VRDSAWGQSNNGKAGYQSKFRCQLTLSYPEI